MLKNSAQTRRKCCRASAIWRQVLGNSVNCTFLSSLEISVASIDSSFRVAQFHQSGAYEPDCIALWACSSAHGPDDFVFQFGFRCKTKRERTNDYHSAFGIVSAFGSRRQESSRDSLRNPLRLN